MILQLLRDWLWLQRSQWLGKQQLAEVQARKLRAMVTHAFENVPFYHRLYERAGVDVASVRDSTSISRLPTITKRDLMNTPLAERTARNMDLNSCIALTTSGSTGMPITTLREPRAVSYQYALTLRHLWAYGVRPSHKICVSIPGLREDSVFFSTGGLRGFALRRKVRPLSLAADVLDSYRFISKWKPDLLWAPPSFFRALIRVCEERQQDVSFKVACTSGEMLDSSTRKLIGDRFHAEVFSLYGLADAGCVAWECPTHSGYHIDVDSLLTEFIRDGQSVAAGEAGELCVTNLYRKAAPVIRYLVGDIAIPLDADCSCGRGLPLLKGIQGRILDFILTDDGRQISPFTVMYTLEGIPGVEQYKVIQESDHSIQVLVKSREIKVEPVLQALRERCRALFGDMPLTIKPVDEIENARGRKFRVVESRLAK